MILRNLVESRFAHTIMNNAIEEGDTVLANALKAAIDGFVLNRTADFDVRTPEELNITDEFVGVIGETVGFEPLEESGTGY